MVLKTVEVEESKHCLQELATTSSSLFWPARPSTDPVIRLAVENRQVYFWTPNVANKNQSISNKKCVLRSEYNAKIT